MCVLLQRTTAFISEKFHRKMSLLCVLLSTCLSLSVADDVGVVQDEESDDGLGSTTYLLVLAVGGATVWWFFFREDKQEAKIPEYNIKPMVIARQQSIASEKGFVNKMINSNRRLVVFYGSQTGTAEEFAGRLAKGTR